MTGDVFPITRKVLKFTETDMRQDRTMKPCNEENMSESNILRINLKRATGRGSVFKFLPALEGYN